MNIRPARQLDTEAIKKVYLTAFPDAEAEIVSKLAIDLLSEETTPPVLSLLAESHDVIIGHICFSPITSNYSKSLQGYILAPLAVLPDYQGQGVGSDLVRHGIKRLSDTETQAIFVYGDPKYYSRFGFTAQAAIQFSTPYKLQYPFGWLALTVNNYSIEEGPVTINCVAALQYPALW